jgi:hypothetical protein
LPAPEERQRRRIDSAVRFEFLGLLAKGWSATRAARATGFSRQRFYELRARDDAFRDDWAAAVDQGTDRLEDEAYRRAVEGVREPIFSRGEVVGERRMYSDRLIEFLLKARRPAVYREQSLVELRKDPNELRQIEEAVERFTRQVKAESLQGVPELPSKLEVLETSKRPPALAPPAPADLDG